MKIETLVARQILDSRGMPTVEVRVGLDCKTIGVGSAPAGASTGSHEAHEKRDGGKAYGGNGVMQAVEAVNTTLRGALIGMDADEQEKIDARMIELDGSADKSVLGANALIAVSWAVAEAAAKCHRLELFRWLGGMRAGEMPCPMMNCINGGRHADNNLEIQEFMFVPSGADSFHEAMRMGCECAQALKAILREKGLSTAVGDEGGFAPDLRDDAEALEMMLRAIERSGWQAGEDVELAIDAAASEWKAESGYRQNKSGRRFERNELIEYYEGLCKRFPLISIEDPLDEEDFDGFREITDQLGEGTMIVGDDLFTTDAQRIFRGVALGAANAVLIKPNQIGTVTETLQAVRLAERSAYDVVISHRSGETGSAAIADLAVAVGAGYIKAGAPARGERLAKYNRLLEIEDMFEHE